MGEAKRRGTFEQRKAQAVDRRKAEEARRAEQRARMAAEQREREAERNKLLSPQERKEAILMVDGGHDTRMALAMAMGLAAPLLVIDRSREQS